MTQKNELFIQIDWSYKYRCIKNWKEKKKKGKNTENIKTMALHKYMTDRPIFQFNTSNKTSIRIFLTNFWVQEHRAIHKYKGTSFMHLLITKRSFQQWSGLE